MRRLPKIAELDFAEVRVDAYVVDKMERPAEAALLDEALKRLQPRLSVRKAAAAAGISEGWWRQITKGIQSRSTGSIPVVAPAETIARMALAVGVTSAELEAAGRTDAAEVLPAIEQQHATSVNLSSIPDEELAAEFLRRMKGARDAVRQTPSSGAPDETGQAQEDELDDAQVLAAARAHLSGKGVRVQDAYKAH